MAEYNFSASLDGWIAKTEKRLNAFALEFSQEIFFEFVTKTPFKTGFAKNSWYPDIGTLGENPNKPNKETVTPSQTPFANFAARVANLKYTDILWIANSANYIIYLEYGHSTKSPDGMVRVTLANAQSIAARVAARIQNGL